MTTKHEDKMQRISKVAAQTGISVDTLRRWARDGELTPAVCRKVLGTPAWYTTVAAALERAAKPHKFGRKVKRTGA